jgi:hypothetical protein
MSVRDIPNGYTSNVVLDQQAQVAHRWWSGLWPDPAAQLHEAHGGFPNKQELMADSSRRAYGGLACCTRHSIGLSLGLHVVSAPELS